MKLGYFTMPVHPPARRYVETLKEDREAFILADRLGYSEGYCGEHLTDAAENIPNSMMFIATLLGAVSQMKVGTAVVNLPHSHPVVVASNAAMLDNLFEGRFILGIGAGILRSDAEALGLLEADRNDMFAEAIDHILALWAGTAPIDRKGKHWTISTVRTLWPEVGIGDIVKPYQKPHPPIAGTATDPDSKGLIALGRRGWWPISSHFLHPNCLKSQWANYAKGCVEGGHRAERANWRVARSIFVAEDDRVARAYGGDDAKEGETHDRLQAASGHAGRGRHLRLHLRQRRDPRQRESRRRSHPGAARSGRGLRHAALLRQGLGRPAARPQVHGADGRKVMPAVNAALARSMAAE
jgi:alkanesulfonate monooxygenase SsuD/methylene tetrahydromethanopterin reductase-like flavin-dependent oxidoreductase (luciferase family)